MTDFPPISKEDNHEVLYHFISAHFKNTSEIIIYASIPDKMGGAPLKVKGKRTKISEKEDAPAPKPKRTKVSKTEASTASDTGSALREEVIQKKRTKGDRDLQKTVKEGAEEWMNEEEEEEPKKKKTKQPLEIVSPMMVATRALARMAKDYADNAIAEKKQLAEQYKLERDERLKAAGIVETNPLSDEKAAEILALSTEVKEQTVKEATGLLQEALTRGKGTSEAAASESASEAVRSEALLSGNSSDPKAHINIQIPCSSPSSSSSSSTDSDDITLSQRYKKPLPKSKTTKTSNQPQKSSFGPSNIDERTISLSERRIEVCKKLPADHPLQPPVIQALNVIYPEQSSSQTPSSDIPEPSSPSTLFSLEKHLGGEMSVTPQKASKTVPEKTVVENQQPPSPVIEEEPEVHIEL
ncbi:uncharacterized protein DDB_G0284459-like [Medicago truncatula]|uniref:uncharacterized protein DDB_G0284459-like n=1 Tax=Medicago truncatula TaxID=3880 RepID=UPI000D2F3436|nr:uncharacterized protein DDB_G0284459-like [Medicago truncatula]